MEHNIPVSKLWINVDPFKWALDNDFMAISISGHVQNGVIVLDGSVTLPEGAVVTVVYPAQGAKPQGVSGRPANPSAELPGDDRPIWERIAELAATLPSDAIASLPSDGASHLDHYLYGAPKRTP